MNPLDSNDDQDSELELLDIVLVLLVLGAVVAVIIGAFMCAATYMRSITTTISADTRLKHIDPSRCTWTDKVVVTVMSPSQPIVGEEVLIIDANTQEHVINAGPLRPPVNSNTFSYSTHMLPPGVYYAGVRTSGGIIIGKSKETVTVRRPRIQAPASVYWDEPIPVSFERNSRAVPVTVSLVPLQDSTSGVASAAEHDVQSKTISAAKSTVTFKPVGPNAVRRYSLYFTGTGFDKDMNLQPLSVIIKFPTLTLLNSQGSQVQANALHRLEVPWRSAVPIAIHTSPRHSSYDAVYVSTLPRLDVDAKPRQYLTYKYAPQGPRNTLLFAADTLRFPSAPAATTVGTNPSSCAAFPSSEVLYYFVYVSERRALAVLGPVAAAPPTLSLATPSPLWWRQPLAVCVSPCAAPHKHDVLRLCRHLAPCDSTGAVAVESTMKVKDGVATASETGGMYTVSFTGSNAPRVPGTYHVDFLPYGEAALPHGEAAHSIIRSMPFKVKGPVLTAAEASLYWNAAATVWVQGWKQHGSDDVVSLEKEGEGSRQRVRAVPQVSRCSLCFSDALAPSCPGTWEYVYWSGGNEVGNRAKFEVAAPLMELQLPPDQWAQGIRHVSPPRLVVTVATSQLRHEGDFLAIRRKGGGVNEGPCEGKLLSLPPEKHHCVIEFDSEHLPEAAGTYEVVYVNKPGFWSNQTVFAESDPFEIVTDCGAPSLVYRGGPVAPGLGSGDEDPTAEPGQPQGNGAEEKASDPAGSPLPSPSAPSGV